MPTGGQGKKSFIAGKEVAMNDFSHTLYHYLYKRSGKIATFAQTLQLKT
jgi:hypothetical protein